MSVHSPTREEVRSAIARRNVASFVRAPEEIEGLSLEENIDAWWNPGRRTERKVRARLAKRWLGDVVSLALIVTGAVLGASLAPWSFVLSGLTGAGAGLLLAGIAEFSGLLGSPDPMLGYRGGYDMSYLKTERPARAHPSPAAADRRSAAVRLAKQR